MNVNTILTLFVLAGVIAGLIRYAHLADFIFVLAVTVLTLAGVITPAEAFAGLTNDGVLTIAALFVVAAGLVETGVLDLIAHRLLGDVQTAGGALRRVVPAVIALSAFLNNTTVVAMSIPVLLEWCRKRRIAASKLLLPLSYAAILGGVCTLIGTSPNLVVHGMLRAAGQPGLGMWELSKVGLPIAIAGGALLVFLGPRLLPDRKEFLEQLGESRREFLVEMIVRPDCPLVGKTVQDAGLRQLPGLFLIEIDRDGHPVAPVEPDERLRANDRLVFTGVVSTIVDLQKTPGLVAAGDDRPAFDPAARQDLCEAVVSTSSPLVGQSVREASFRTIYDAAVIAVHRNGARMRQKIGDIVLRPGDTLLLLTGSGFVRAHRNNPDFFLVSEVGDANPPRRHRAGLAAAITVLLIVAMTLPDVLPIFPALRDFAAKLSPYRAAFAILAAGAMLVTGCLPSAAARRNIDWQVLLTIGAAFGLSRALENSGAAAWLGHIVHESAGAMGPMGALATMYVVTWLLTELMSNNAAAALMCPIALATATATGVEPRPLFIAVALAASGGFMIPTGYQTHLMVFGPGGYRLGDFFKLGVPMVLLWLSLAMLFIPLGWSFTGH